MPDNILKAADTAITYFGTNINFTTESVYKTSADDPYGGYQTVQEAAKVIPKSLFYQHTESENGAPSGLFNYYLLGKKLSGGPNGVFKYKGSEEIGNNRKVTPEVSRNPTAANIITTTTTSKAFMDPHSYYIGQPYDVKDFIFCKDYGVVPNNRMITLRRFPTPVLDNLAIPLSSYFPGFDKDNKIISIPNSGITKEEMARKQINIPIAQAVSYFGKGTSNPSLNTLLGFTTGLNWRQRYQTELQNYTKNDPGFYNGFGDIFSSLFNTDINDLIQSANRVGGTLAEPQNIQAIYARKLYDRMRNGENGPLRERIFVDMNTVNKMYTRGLGITDGFQDFSVVFDYDLTSVGDINSRMLFLDLMANLLTIGTDYGKFLVPQILEDPKTVGFSFPGGPAGYTKFLTDPVMWISDILKYKDSPEAKAKKQSYKKEMTQLVDSFKQFTDTGRIVKGDKLYNALTTMLTEKMVDKLIFEPLIVTGYPTGDWHLVVGNPLNPIAMMGNLVCKSVKIEFGEELGPDDFPTSMRATFTLAPARQRHRGDFESMFNRGHGRLYLGELPKTSSTTGFTTPTGAKENTDKDLKMENIARNSQATAETRKGNQ